MKVRLIHKRDIPIKVCPCCRFPSITVKKRHMNTQYVDEASNYITCCLACYEDTEEYWNERWNEYYSSQGWGCNAKYVRTTRSRGPW